MWCSHHLTLVKFYMRIFAKTMTFFSFDILYVVFVIFSIKYSVSMLCKSFYFYFTKCSNFCRNRVKDKKSKFWLMATFMLFLRLHCFTLLQEADSAFNKNLSVDALNPQTPLCLFLYICP